MKRALSDGEDNAGARQYLVARGATSVVVNRGVPVDGLSRPEGRALLAGQIGNWIGGMSAPMLAARRSGHAGSIDPSARPHDLLVRAQQSQDCLLDVLSPGVHPLVDQRRHLMPLPQPDSRGEYSGGITGQIQGLRHVIQLFPPEQS